LRCILVYSIRVINSRLIKSVCYGKDSMKKKAFSHLSRNGNVVCESVADAGQAWRELSVDNQGFTLIELIVVTAILGVLALMAIPAYNSYVNSSKIARAAGDIRTMENDITAYLVDRGTLPDNLDDIGRGTLRDPWGNPYEYYNFVVGGKTPLQDLGLHDLNSEFDLYSKGEDGASAADYSDPSSDDDIVRSGDGGYVGSR